MVTEATLCESRPLLGTVLMTPIIIGSLMKWNHNAVTPKTLESSPTNG